MLGRLNVAKRLARQNSPTGNDERYIECFVEMLKTRDAQTCQQSDTPGSVFGGRVSQQDQSPDFPNVSELCDRLVCDEEAFDGRTISSAIKRYLGTLPVSLLNAHMFASFVASRTNETGTKRCGRSLRTPAGLARALWQVRTGLVKAFGCPGNATAEDRERGWRMATLDYMMRHLREVVALQAINRMSPRALALCLAPSLFGSTDDAETNSQVCIRPQLPSFTSPHAITSSFSGHYLMLMLFHVCHHHHQQVLELLIERWPWLSLRLHRDSQPVSAEGLTEPVADACLYACCDRVSPLHLQPGFKQSEEHRPEQGTALVDRKLALYKVDITALSETWFSDEGQLEYSSLHHFRRRRLRYNQRGISWPKIAGKIFARIIHKRLNNHLEQGLLSDSQRGFCRHRVTTDVIFAARQLQEECQEMRTHLHSTFMYLTKDFDKVKREGLLTIM
nr:unnamed protein product [Spirometra erinaceieuropaei]